MCGCQQAQKRLTHTSEVTGAHMLYVSQNAQSLVTSELTFTCYPYLLNVYVSPHWLLESMPFLSSSLPIWEEKNWYLSKDVCLQPYNMSTHVAAFSMAFPECSVPTFKRCTFSAISLLSTTCTPVLGILSRRGFFEFK